MSLEKYEELVDTLDLLDDEDMRFEYILDLGKQADEEPFPDALMVDANLMHGCMSRVWIIHEEREGRHFFQGASEAAIVKGLVRMMIASFSGLTRDELMGISLDHVRKLNLGALTMQRQVGMMAMLKHFQKLVQSGATTGAAVG